MRKRGTVNRSIKEIGYIVVKLKGYENGKQYHQQITAKILKIILKNTSCVRDLLNQVQQEGAICNDLA